MAKAGPVLDDLVAAREALNSDPSYRKLGSADFKLGLVIGGEALLVTFEAFEVAAVEEADPADMRDAHIMLEMAAKDWNDYLRKRTAGKADSLLALDLDRHVVRARSPLERLMLERYNRTIQAFLDCCANAVRGSGSKSGVPAAT